MQEQIKIMNSADNNNIENIITTEELSEMELNPLINFCTDLIKTGTNKKDFENAIKAMKPNTQIRGWDGARAKEVIRLLEEKMKTIK